MLQGYVISDLHLLTGRSVAHRYLGHIHTAAAQADFFVLNGDIFDFKWTMLASVDHTVTAAVAWVRELVTAHPSCAFHYVLGNHDCIAAFAEALAEVARACGNFHVHPSHLRLGTALFLHGDLPLRRRFRRSRGPAGRKIPDRVLTETVRKKSRFLAFCYRLVVGMRAHRTVDLVRSRWLDVRRLHRALAEDGTHLGEGVTDVYFGHTHAPLQDYRVGGVAFHNTGSAIRGLRCRLTGVRVPKASVAE